MEPQGLLLAPDGVPDPNLGATGEPCFSIQQTTRIKRPAEGATVTNETYCENALGHEMFN